MIKNSSKKSIFNADVDVATLVTDKICLDNATAKNEAITLVAIEKKNNK